MPAPTYVIGHRNPDSDSICAAIAYSNYKNLTGDPAMSVPFGSGADGLPVGVQVLAHALGEPVMLQVAAHLEALTLHGGYADRGDNAALKAAAAKTKPVVQSHLDELKKIGGDAVAAAIPGGSTGAAR